MILGGRAMDPDDDRSEADRKREARTFLRHQGLVSVLSLIGLTLFAIYPNMYMALFAVFVVYGTAKLLDKHGENTERISCKDRAVLVTGCDTGFGHQLVKQLADIDVTVFAGCLSDSSNGATALKSYNPDRIHVIPMDVTNQKQVDSSLAFVNKVTEDKGLWGLVNNAGLNFVGDVELTTMEQFERVANINQLGMVRVTKAFLPLVRLQKGRIVNVTSVKGRVSCIHSAAYSMTKWAGETFSDILRQEMRKFNVQVIIVEPGNFSAATNVLERNRIKQDFREMWKHLPKDTRTTYGKEYVDHHIKDAREAIAAASKDIRLVTDLMEDALFTEKPSARYLIGGSAYWYDPYKLRAILTGILPEWFMDGLQIHGTRNFPTPEALIGQEDH